MIDTNRDIRNALKGAEEELRTDFANDGAQECKQYADILERLQRLFPDFPKPSQFQAWADELTRGVGEGHTISTRTIAEIRDFMANQALMVDTLDSKKLRRGANLLAFIDSDALSAEAREALRYTVQFLHRQL